ncbi:hypothetical protein BCV69DRAFT_10365 [Microstroma glucosiphilum]|uniref:C2H2-type domain-containing protein n=1 Tax=Pseudomicrostroma glucosiphilum TaxID=1684307 RepID=A0A316UEX5_9BASI|nr:hypothetical protein BCV69DRAFT_10365 [Pseudomicrostroma glucosiphilum]PWN23789.1 hypothetical protein BCV69DRAFT_10365 [Pseudomicrostroma glucosiphilum]
MHLPTLCCLYAPLSLTIGYKPHVCNVPGCEAAYSQSFNLKQHKESKHADSEFPCTVRGCGRVYASSLPDHRLQAARLQGHRRRGLLLAVF